MLRYHAPKVGVFETYTLHQHSYEMFHIRVGHMARGSLAEEALSARTNEQGWGDKEGTPNDTSAKFAALYERLFQHGARWFYDYGDWSHTWVFQLYDAHNGAYCEPHIELEHDTSRWRALGPVAKLVTQIGKRAGDSYDMHPSAVMDALRALKYQRIDRWNGDGKSVRVEWRSDLGSNTEPRQPPADMALVSVGVK